MGSSPKEARYTFISVLFSKLIVFCGHSKLTSSLLYLLVIIECDHKRLWLRSTTRKIILWALLRDFVCRFVAKKTPGATLSKSILVSSFPISIDLSSCSGPTRTPPFSAIGILIQFLNVPNWRYDRFITDFCHPTTEFGIRCISYQSFTIPILQIRFGCIIILFLNFRVIAISYHF